MMERDALTTNPAASPAAMPARASGAGALGAVARHQQERVRQRLAHERSCAGAVAPATAPTSL